MNSTYEIKAFTPVHLLSSKEDVHGKNKRNPKDQSRKDRISYKKLRYLNTFMPETLVPENLHQNLSVDFHETKQVTLTTKEQVINYWMITPYKTEQTSLAIKKDLLPVLLADGASENYIPIKNAA